jgi:acetylornithine deacetylase
MDKPEDLLAELVACDSTNPSLVAGGAGESAVAALVAERLRAAGLEVTTWEARPGRANVLGVLRGTGGGRNLLLCSHLDVVGAEASGFTPAIREGRLYGRGASDMKGGLTASIVAATELAASGTALAGDLLVAGVIDEEWLSAGALDLVDRLRREAHRVDAAILSEATGLDLIVEHGGFAWWEVRSVGAEAAGDDPERGVDAIALLGGVLTGLLELDAELALRRAKPYGRPCLHASTIAGGRQLSAYPDSCVLGVERCTVPGETVDQAQAELEAVIDRAVRAEPRLTVEMQTIVAREAISLPATEPIVRTLAAASGRRRGEPATIRGDMGWMDSGILVEAGMPCVAFGPVGDGEHTAQEWVDLDSVRECAAVLADTAREFCGAQPGRARDHPAAQG